MEKEFDIFGIETDESVQRRADKIMASNYQERIKIVDSDIYFYRNNYKMLDNMSFEKTIAEKKKYIINYIIREVTKDRFPDAISSGGFSNRIAAKIEYISKPIDPEMVSKMADYILDTYKNSDKVKYYRVGPDSGFNYYDKNGVCVEEARYSNQDLVIEYKYKIALKKFPPETHKDLYFSTKYGDSDSLKRAGTEKDFISSALSYEDTKELIEEAKMLAEMDSRYIKLEPIK